MSARESRTRMPRARQLARSAQRAREHRRASRGYLLESFGDCSLAYVRRRIAQRRRDEQGECLRSFEKRCRRAPPSKRAGLLDQKRLALPAPLAQELVADAQEHNDCAISP